MRIGFLTVRTPENGTAISGNSHLGDLHPGALTHLDSAPGGRLGCGGPVLPFPDIF